MAARGTRQALEAGSCRAPPPQTNETFSGSSTIFILILAYFLTVCHGQNHATMFIMFLHMSLTKLLNVQPCSFYCMILHNKVSLGNTSVGCNRIDSMSLYDLLSFYQSVKEMHHYSKKFKNYWSTGVSFNRNVSHICKLTFFSGKK